MKILLFGKNGQVGWELNRTLQSLGEVIALGREDADFSAPETLRNIVQDIKPDVIVNAVAYTAVDKAEEEEELAEIINAIAPGILAEEALKINALLVHYSTDYVFDGTKDSPYVETDKPNPINAYGRTKLAGEMAIQSSSCDYLIFRTSWVYASRGHNFLLTILKLAKERDVLSIVADQHGSPTSSKLISETSFYCIKHAMKDKQTCEFTSGLYHLTASMSTTWHGFAEQIVNYICNDSDTVLNIKDLRETLTENYPTPAKRPLNSRLSLNKLETKFGVKMPTWKQCFKQCMEEWPKG